MYLRLKITNKYLIRIENQWNMLVDNYIIDIYQQSLSNSKVTQCISSIYTTEMTKISEDCNDFVLRLKQKIKHQSLNYTCLKQLILFRCFDLE